MKLLISACFLLLNIAAANAQTISISGKVTTNRQPAGHVTVSLQHTSFGVITADDGTFSLKDIPAGDYTIQASAIGYATLSRKIKVSKNDLFILIPLSEDIKQLNAITIQSISRMNSGYSRLHDVEGTAIYAGKKTEVIVLKNIVANTATNNSRQLYAKVAGLNIWENDGAGIQLAIGGRGLNPNRVSNFNTRQNGYDISADALGYPESYYTPPAEAVERIEILRGAASLQYGTQFGGMINFKMNQGADSQRIAITSRLTTGSWNFLNSSSDIGGTMGKLNYYAFYQHKSGDGWRPNAGFHSNTAYAAASYRFTNRLSLTLQYTFMEYLEQQPGGLTDADFQKEPRQSVRERNWFKVRWNLAAAALDYQISNRLTFNTRFFGLQAARDALGLLTYINRADDGARRNLYIDHYRNWGNESRMLYQYNISGAPATALLGVRYYSGDTHREQGYGNNGSNADFTFMSADSLRYSNYRFPNHNVAIFAENIFHATPQLSIIPGIRFENITTRANGRYTNVIFDLSGNPIHPEKIQDDKISRRHFLIGGIGAMWNFKSGIQAYANISQNYKAINFNDLRTLNPNVRVDSNLQDEKGYSADIGFRKNSGIFNYDVSFFMINYDNKIGNQLSADTLDFIVYNLRTNVGATRHFGIESLVEADVWKWWKGAATKTSLIVFSNCSLLSARYIHSRESAIDGKQVEFVPALIFKTGVTWRRNRWAAAWQFSYTGKQYTDATNAVFTANAIDGIVPAYHIMDFSAAYHLNKHFSFSGAVNNLANAKYFTRRADSYPGPGIVPSDARGFYLTAQIRY